MTDPSHVRISGALQPFAAGFATELARQGYAPRSLLYQLHLMAHVSRWLTEEGLDVSDLAIQALRFLRRRRAAGYTHHLTGRALRPMLTYLRDLGAIRPAATPVPTGPVERALARYRHYLTVERGLGEATARGYVDAVRRFLCSRLSSDGLDLDFDQLSEADVTAFVVACCSPHEPRRAAKLTVTALRSLLGFLHVEGAITRPLAAAVPSVAGWRLAGLPKGLEPGHVRRLLASCDCRTPVGCRDFAILTTLARLGLRAAEVATLRLDDIDWRVGELVVHGKGTRAERLPLPTDVGAAIAAYLRGRWASAQGRTVFVRLMAPHGALSPTGVTHVVAAAARRTGLGLIHAHRLRHFVATQMLGAGASLSEIKQLLRHARAQTTAIYAKVDRDALRMIARPWPGGAA